MSVKSEEPAGIPAEADDLPVIRFDWKLTLLMGVAGLAVLLSGLYFYQSQERALRTQIENDITSIALLKAKDISRWRADLLSYADSITKRPYFPSSVYQYIQSPTAELEGSLRQMMSSEAVLLGCDNIVITTVDGDIHLSLAKYTGAVRQALPAYLEEAFRLHGAVISDFYLSPGTNKPRIDVIAPVFIKNGDTESRVGALILSVDPAQFLYKLIQSWPVTTSSAEMVMVESNGGNALFLNELRFARDSALKMSVPLTETGVIAVKAATGQVGFIEGKDYRGQDVLAAIQHIEGSPWYLIAKMDRAEALSIWQWQSVLVLTVFVMLLLSSMLAMIGLIWQGTRRQTYQTLYESEKKRHALAERYRLLADNSEDVIWTLDPQLRFTYVSPSVSKLRGLTPEEAMQENLTDSLTPDSKQRLQQIIEDMMSMVGKGKGVSIRLEIEQYRKDGSTVWVEIAVKEMLDESAKFSGLIGVSRDISDRKRHEQELKESQEKFGATFNTSPDPYAVIDIDTGRLIDINPAYVKWSGYSERELIGRTMTALDLWVNAADLDQLIARLQTEDTIEDVPISFRIKNGEIRDTWFSARAIDIAGVKCLLSRTHDITARNRIQQSLKESEDKFRRFFEMAPEYCFIIANNGRIIDVNNSALAALGYDRRELINESVQTLLNQASREKAKHLVEKWRKYGHVDGAEIVMVTKTGGERKTLLSLSSATNKEGKVMYSIAFLRDITNLKRLEEERQRADKLESVGTLAGGIAHDFNNVLTAILGNISLAGMMVKPDDESQVILLEAERAALRAKDLTQQLLTFSKGGLPIKKVSSLDKLLVDTATFALRGSNVKCHFNIQPDLSSVNIDEGQIGQVISNLVINARQAMPSGGTINLAAEDITLTGQQSLGSTLPLDDGDYLRVTVSDGGTGIKPEHLDKIFDPYFTTKKTGSGLGLAICYSIVRNHGGHISVESQPDEGTTFYIYLPATREKAVSNQKASVKLNVKPDSKLLIMDDEAIVCEITGRLLNHIGYKEVEFAPHGEKAIELYRAALGSDHPFDAVILDFTIPGGMGAAETMLRLRGIDPDVKAIITSGYAEEQVISNFKQYGFKAALAKPFTLDELKQALSRCLGAD